MPSSQLSELHLSELHARAAEAGIDGFRMLRREELIKALGDGDGDGDGGDDGEAPKRSRRRRGGRGRGGRGRERLTDAPREKSDGEEDTRDVVGVLELTRQRHGFLSLTGEHEGEPDVYVSAAQVRRCELTDGDEVSGPAREPRRGERHPALVHVDKVNGEDPVPEPEKKSAGTKDDKEEEAAPAGPDFDALTPVTPTRRIQIPDDAPLLARAAATLAPLAFGQRVLVRAAPRSGRTTLLRALGSAMLAGGASELVVLLIDERPEELTEWREAVPDAEIAAATADLSPREQVKVANEVLEGVRAASASGADVVLLCDSLSRLATAAGDVAGVKRLFGSGRELEGSDSGSLTVIATTFAEGEDGGEAERAVATTENATIVLDASLAEQGIEPALRVSECRSSGEDRLLSDEELDALRGLRAELAGLVPPEAAALLRERLS